MKQRLHAPIVLGEPIVRPDGSIEVEHKVLVYGTQAQRGTDGKMREFALTPELAAEMVANCEKDRATGYEAPVFVGHPDERDKAPAVGWVKGLRAGDDGLYATVRYLAPMAYSIQREEFKHVSPTFTFDHEDQHGEPCGAKLLDIGVLNTPHQKNLGPIPLAEAAYTLSEVGAPAPDEDAPPGDNTAAGGSSMSITQEQLSAALAAALADFDKKQDEKLTARLSEFAASLAAKVETTEADGDVTKLSESVIRLSARMDKAESDLKAATGDLERAKVELAEANTERDAYKRELSVGRITGLVNDGLANGTLEAKDVPGFGTEKFDAIKWLSESKFNGEKGLRIHVATATPVVSFSDRRRSAPTANAQPADDLDTMPYDTRTFASREEFKQFALASRNGGDPRVAARS